LRKALWFWSRREPIDGSIAETYLREARGIKGPIPNSLFYLPAYKAYPPAMIAALGIDRVSGVHITNLKQDGSDKAYPKDDPLKRQNKIMIGLNTYGLPIVLAPTSDSNNGLAITEGIEDGLSVHLATGLGIWVAGDAGRMPALAEVVPSDTECVTIVVDDDEKGRANALHLAHRLQARGIYVEQALNWGAAA
jgi:putative DNA primase/helicase